MEATVAPVNIKAYNYLQGLIYGPFSTAFTLNDQTGYN